jgi:Tol biopolymer transport system component
MSPEQARGKAVDKRTDVWAFGCVLYEMLAGQRVFQGHDVAEILASVIKEEPNWSAIPKQVPPSVAQLLRRCLKKDRAERLRDVGDARLLMDEITPAAPPLLTRTDAFRKWRLGAAVLVGAAFVGVGSVLFLRTNAQPAGSDFGLARFGISAPMNASFGPGTEASPTISPDGRVIAFIARRAESSSATLWIRPIASLDARELTGTDGATLPFWSPDSRYIGFAAQNRIQTMEISSGRPQTICDLPVGQEFEGATWNRDGVIVFAAGRAMNPLMRVAAPSSLPEAPKPVGASIRGTHPYFLPDGKHFLVLARNRIALASLDGEAPRALLVSETRPAYAPSGHILYVVNGNLFAQAFDPVHLRLAGEPAGVADRVVTNLVNGRASFSVSDSGTLVYRAGDLNVDAQLTWFDRHGGNLGTVGPSGRMGQISLSPDETKVVLARPVPGPNNDVWVLDLGNGALSRVTFDSATKSDPIWTPDGKTITYNKIHDSQMDIFQRTLGSTTEVQLTDSPTSEGPDDWSTDGKLLLLNSRPSVFTLSVSGDRRPMKWADIPGYVDEPHFSPDTHWVAYSSDESGQNEIYVASFPIFGAKRQVSVAGGTQPRWRRDGRELFFLNLDRKLMSIAVTPGPTLSFAAPRVLFQTSVPNPTQDQYDVSANGEKFLVLTAPVNSEDTSVTAVFNWTTLLKR